MKTIKITPTIFLFNLLLIMNITLLTACSKDDDKNTVTEIINEVVDDVETDNSNDNSTDDTSNDNNDNSVQTTEKELVTTSYDENGNISSTSTTRLVFEEGRIVEEIFPDLAASEEGKFLTKKYEYNEEQLIIQITISDEFAATENQTYAFQYNEEDVIINIKETSNTEGFDLTYQETNSAGEWEYTNPRGERGLIAFDERSNWIKFETLGASTTDIGFFYSNTYDTEAAGFYPDAPKYYSFLSWLTTVFNFYPSDGHFMTSNALQIQASFWGSEEDYRNENFDEGDYANTTLTNDFDSDGNLVKISFTDTETGQIVGTTELK